MLLLVFLGAFAGVLHTPSAKPIVIAGHGAKFDSAGHLLSWIPWNVALDREMDFYEGAPTDHGYPIFVTTTFLDGDWRPWPEHDDIIPATQNGLGIISYLNFYELRGKRNPKTLQLARAMGNYLITEDLTADAEKFPRFTRSTGRRGIFPQPPDSGMQADRPYEIEPDKGGVAGYALVLLYDATQDRNISRKLYRTLATWRKISAPATQIILPGPFASTIVAERPAAQFPAI
jgi:hypothetical protein